MSHVVVSGSFDDLSSRQVRVLHEASRLGPVHVLLWSDDVTRQVTGQPPKFPHAERAYFLRALRYVTDLTTVSAPDDAATLPDPAASNRPLWVMDEADHTPAREAWCRRQGVGYRVFSSTDLDGFPSSTEATKPHAATHPKVIVTGCFDWLHTGHVRFFEEASRLGDLYAAVGHDANVKALKGAHHPLFPQQQRRYMVGSIRFVHQALITSGDGWLDAEPEIERLRPDFYVVNEDGDRPEKRRFCESRGLRYVVLQREPKPGLPRRQSTDLRGF